MNRRVLLMILDGWGLGNKPKVSAIQQAETPFMDEAWNSYPHSQLNASGLAVGLPEGQMGNSEVGHMNIGAGRVVYQDLVKINNALKDGSLAENKVLISVFDKIKNSSTKLHLMGLVSDGGVHSHIDHLKGLCELIQDQNLSDRLFLHAFTDGRDCDPQSGADFINDLQQFLNDNGGEIASVTGRYYAMDRDQRWERIKLAYDAMVRGEGEKSNDLVESIKNSYQQGVTDEFIKPIIAVDEDDNPLALIEDGDTVICFNFRTDRGRQITQVLTQRDFPEHNMKTIPLQYVTLTNYDPDFEDVEVIFRKDDLVNTLGEIVSKAGLKQLRIAETEKYPHVTFFFSGGREKEFENENRILCPSPKVATYDLKPEMSAYQIRDAIIPELKSKSADFICLNFANPDMVGHTGDFKAAVKACETVDDCASMVTETALANDYAVLIIADHGNADYMVNEDGSPNTAHTTNPVPCILIDQEHHPLSDGKLGDLAPTILTLMGLDIPEEMTGVCLL